MGLCFSKQNWPAINSDALALPMELTVQEIREATGNFSPARLIGEVNFATVYKASFRNGFIAAAKRLDFPAGGGSWEARNVAILKEQIPVVSLFKHDNVVRLLGYAVAGDLPPVLLYEFASMGTLYDALHGTRPEERQGLPAAARQSRETAVNLSWPHRVRIALDVAMGLAYMHDEVLPPVLHGDVRSRNVLLFDGFKAKITDYNMFGNSQINHAYKIVGSVPMAWTAPEVPIQGRHLSKKTDVFSFGVVLLELMTGRLPLNSGTHLDDWALPLLMKGRLDECIDPKLGDRYCPAQAYKLGKIAARCVQWDPALRPSSMRTVAREIKDDVLCS